MIKIEKSRNVFFKKKAQVFKNLMYIMNIIFLAIISLTIVMLVRSSTVKTVDTFELESNLFITELLYSPGLYTDCDYQKERCNTGTVQISFFQDKKSEDKILKRFDYGDKNLHIGAKLTLTVFERTIDNGVVKWKDKQIPLDRPLLDIYYNQEKYDAWDVLAKLGTPGAGGARATTRQIYVNAMDDNGKTFPAILTIRVVMPNS